MRFQLTRAVFRQITYNELQSGTGYWFSPAAQQCLRTRRAPSVPPIPRRFFFGFSRTAKRQPKPKNYALGQETMVHLSDRLRTGVRTQPPKELAQAFILFFKSRPKRTPIDDIQAQHALTTFEHLQKTDADDKGMALVGSEELRMALNVLKSPSTRWSSKTHNKLARAIFAELQNRRATRTDDLEPQVGQDQDLVPFIHIMALSGDALYARELVEVHWDDCLKDTPTTPWTNVLRGLIVEGKTRQVEETVEIMQKRGVPFDYKVHETIIVYFAGRNQDMEMTKRWYSHPIAGNRPPTLRADSFVLKLCIQKNEIDWGDAIFKSLLERHSGDKTVWNIIFLWSAAKGKSVDEIERMMQVMVRRSEDEGTPLRPDMETINGLIELANTRDDSYRAERYVALGQRWGLQPDTHTYLLQLDYRIKVGDLGGARTAYAHLQAEEIKDDEDLPLVNKLIIALSAEKVQNYDAIMGLVEDLSERKARFEPATVAALSSIHLQRGEMDDLIDLLNTHAFHYGLDQRALISNVLLAHCLDSSTPTSRAWDTYNILRQTFAEIDIPTRTTLMNSFFSRDRSDMATHVFGHMRQQQIKSFRPTVATYAQCLSGLSRAHDRESLKIVHNMIKLDNEIEPDTQLYNALMLGYSGCGYPDTALTFWEDILHSREGPSYASIQIALRACERAIEGEDIARDIWAKLRKLEIEVTREIYAAYVGALAGQDLFDECVALIDKAEKELRYKPDALLLGTFYNATRGIEERSRVKEWAWKAYPAAYEDLLKFGTITIVKLDEDGEEERFTPKESYFDIGFIGRDVEP